MKTEVEIAGVPSIPESRVLAAEVQVAPQQLSRGCQGAAVSISNGLDARTLSSTPFLVRSSCRSRSATCWDSGRTL